MSAAQNLDFKALFEACPSRFLVLDQHFDILAVTNTYNEATLTKREEIIGKNLFEVFPDNPNEAGATGESNLRASLKRVIAQKRPDAMAVQKYDVPKPESTTGEFEVRYWSPINTPVLDGKGNLEYIIHAVEDVTEFVALQSSSTKAAESDHIQAEIMRRGQELQDLNEELRQASVAKSEFLSRMSHELRTPFTAVLGFGELLNLSELDEEQHEMVDVMLKAAKHLMDMLDDILDISRIEAGHLSILVESVSVKTVVNDAVSLIRPLASTYGVDVKEDLTNIQQHYVAADRQRLRQVLINLLSNAVKYNRYGGSVEVLGRIIGDETVHIEVTDTGIGIDQAVMDRLFVPFDRLGAGERGIEGTGLGLSLSRQLAESMGATLDVRSVVGQGSTFTIEMPLVEPNALKEFRTEYDAVVDVRPYERERKVLYVEDTIANAQLIERILLRRPAVKLHTIPTGADAIAMVQKSPPDLILLDLHLPDMGGEDVLKAVRELEVGRNIPVVVLSADATERQKDELLEAGASAYLTKPVGVKELLERVDIELGEVL